MSLCGRRATSRGTASGIIWHPGKACRTGTFIAQQKFQYYPDHNVNAPFYISTANQTYQIWGFNVTNTIPFPTQDSPSGAEVGMKTPQFNVPYIAFNYMGQLTVDGLNLALNDEYIPLAQGTVSAAIRCAHQRCRHRPEHFAK